MPISGRLYTYRIALVNRDDATLRNVEVQLTSLPEDVSRSIPVDKYEAKIMAISESGEMAVAELAFIPRPDQIPEFRILKMQSFPGAAGSSS